MPYQIEQLLERKDVKNMIMESLRRTRGTNKEHMFNFCATKGDMVTTDIEEGEKHTVGDVSRCHGDVRVIGAYHTHTRLTKDGDVVPSPRDIIKSTEEDLEFFCIGGNKGDIGIVRCFNKNDMLLEINTILEITKKPMDIENIGRAARLMVGHMLQERRYLNQLSYTRLYNIE